MHEAETPEIIDKNPAIDSFITNMIDTNHGIQIPALLHSLVETFGRDGVTQTIFSDKNLLNYINKKILQKGNLPDETPSHIGRGVGTHIDYSGEHDPNKDPFTLLVPSKDIF